jgi:isoleucyl-tRNA synthetase
MRGNLPANEPGLLDRWSGQDLYARLREDGRDRERFVLHDGPPYANGHLHIGHALNKILKDVISRCQQMQGRDAPYVPGWDCHGLPIEWEIEKRYREKGRNKDEVPLVEFRRECREFASHWIDVQREEFKRLGVLGDWERPYLTMTYSAEAQIVRELGKFLTSGQLYRGPQAVMWSPVEKTALAEAEIEYHDKTSTTITVRFPVVKATHPALDGAAVLIWTTTPWTIPGNRAVAYGPDLDYVAIRVTGTADGSLARMGEVLVLAEALATQVLAEAGITGHEVVATFKGSAFEGAVCAHPFHGRGYDFEVPLLPGDHVTTEQGTGLVHTAPGHGEEDFLLGRAFGLEVPDTVAEDGTYTDQVPIFAGDHVFKVDDRMCDELTGAGALLARGKLRHSYPHSWRSKAPVIFRATRQWFISMEQSRLREKALAAIDKVRWVPETGRNRIRSMVETRPDWLVSRQRAWGVPITVFVDRKTGEPLRDPEVIDRVAVAVAEEGAEAWYTRDPAEFLGKGRNPEDYEQVTDILDVWFDSGSTHSFTLEGRNDLKWPASLYLEGSDQHRGWFQSSLLESCGTRGTAPYEAVLTHGFVLDGEGRKMSKSVGNVIAPQQVIEQYGADILRLWVVSADYSQDVRISKEILSSQADAYRRLRNTFRYLLGALDGFTEAERLPLAEMPELERFILHRLWELDGQIRKAIAAYDFHTMATLLHNFCAVDLSAFYFDVRKDVLYCDAPDSIRRRATRTVMDLLFDRLTVWSAPILVFTAEEAWLARFPEGQVPEGESVHRRVFPDTDDAWRNDTLADRWRRVRQIRRVITGAIEVERREKRIRASLEAHPTVWLAPEHAHVFDGLDPAELSITSDATLTGGDAPADAFRLDDVPGVAVVVGRADGEKCARCWKVLPEVGTHADHPELCDRCADAVAHG